MDTINNKNFDEIISSDKLTLVDFSATWCMPCRMVAPILEKIQEGNSDLVNIVRLDIDESEDIAKRYRVFSVPTLMLFKNGENIDSMVGLNTYEKILEFITKHSK